MMAGERINRAMIHGVLAVMVFLAGIFFERWLGAPQSGQVAEVDAAVENAPVRNSERPERSRSMPTVHTPRPTDEPQDFARMLADAGGDPQAIVHRGAVISLQTVRAVVSAHFEEFLHALSRTGTGSINHAPLVTAIEALPVVRDGRVWMNRLGCAEKICALSVSANDARYLVQFSEEFVQLEGSAKFYAATADDFEESGIWERRVVLSMSPEINALGYGGGPK